MEIFLGLTTVIVLILINGFFVAGEFGIVTVDRSRIEQLADEEDHRGAISTLKALRTLSFQLSGAQLGITITSLLVGFLIEPAIAPLIEPVVEAVGLGRGSAVAISVGAALGLATSAQMVVGELVPKNLAIARPERVAFAVATPLRVVNAAMKPLIVFLNASANATVRLLGIEPVEELIGVQSLEEFQVLIRSSREGGGLREEEASLLSRSITFGDKTASDALLPRVDIVHLSTEDTCADLISRTLDSGHSRFPVCREGIDDIVGIAYVKDSYAVAPERRSSTPVTEIMRPPLVVPEMRDLASLLFEMRRERKHVVVVVDEYGGTAGIITLEDVLEEIVGDIEDEYDRAAAETRETASPSGVHVVSGSLHPDEVREQTGFVMPEGDYDTLAGFLLSLFDRIPDQGEHVAHDGWEFKVVTMDKNRISEVLVVEPPHPRASEDDDG